MTLRVAEFQQTSSYAMQYVREAYEIASGVMPGVIDTWTVAVTPPLTVNIGSNNWCLVDATPIGGKGLYFVENTTATDLVVATGNATNPRIDQVYVQVTDTAHGGGSDTAVLAIAGGTPTAGATLTNRSGAATLPAASLRIFDILVPAGATSITQPVNIRDKSIHARGSNLYNLVASSVVTTGAATQSAPTTATAANTVRTATSTRLQSSGNPCRVTFRGAAQMTSLGVGVTAAQHVMLVPMYSTDATSAAGGTTWTPMNSKWGYLMQFPSVGQPEGYWFDHWWAPPSAGDYLIELGAYHIGQTGTAPVTAITLLGGSNTAPQITVEEMVQPAQTLRNN